LQRPVNGLAKLTHVNPRKPERLLLTKIDTIFEVFDDETEAVNSFSRIARYGGSPS